MIEPVKTSVTHEAQVNAWFTVDAMPAAWRAAAPDLCAQFAQILRDKAMKAYKVGFMDGAAQAKDTRDNATFEADSAIGECLACLAEVEYLSKTNNTTFQPLWYGDGKDARTGKQFISDMETASGLIIQSNTRAQQALDDVQTALGLNGETPETVPQLNTIA